MPEIPGGHAGALFEQLAEIVLIAVSHFKGNVAGAHLGGFQQSFCLVDAQQGLLPGVYTVEATAQTADILLLSLDRYRGKTPLFLGIDRVTFLQKIIPGDTMAKKRANGEGNIRKRKDGRWEGRYTAGHDPETGKPIYKNVLGRTQAEAKSKLKAAIEETKSLDVTKTGKYTVGAWMDEWFENYAKIKVRPSSHQTYRGYIDNHIKPNIGKVPLEKLTSLELQKLYKKLLTSGRIDRVESKHQAKGLSPKTVRNIHQIIASAMKLAKEQKIIAADPTEGCALPKLEHREMKTLPVEQLTSFLREAEGRGVFEMYYVELATGLRRGELLGLKWEDIDFEHGNLRVKRQIARIDGEIVEAPLKTKNSYRTLPLAEDTIVVLNQQRKKVGSSPWVFPSPTGGPISPDSVLHMLHRVLKRAGLPKVRFHDLRHTFATLALQNGVDVKTVSGMLGHFSAGFTLDTYAHVTTAAQKEAARTMEKVLTAAL